MKGFFYTATLTASIFILAITLSSGQSNVSVTSGDKPVRFAIIGDRTGGHVEGIYEKIVAEVERMKPDFVLTVGDMIEGYSGDTALLNREWKEYKGIIAPLSMPVYFTPGNHDITYDAALETYRKNIGDPYYSFDRGGIHFVILDNSRWESSPELPKEQLDWLARDLSENQRSAHTFVFFHKPFWYDGIADNKPDTLHSLFRRFGVDAVFSGHFHLYYSGTYDNIYYTDVGSSGGATDPGPTGLQYHFLWVTVDNRGISMSPVILGSVLPWDELTVADTKFIDRMSQSGVDFTHPYSLGKDLRPLDTMVSVTIHNLSPRLTIDDTLKWNVPSGWTISPSIMPVIIQPGDSMSIKFSAGVVDKVYPSPEIALRFPYSEGKKTGAKATLPVARQTDCHRAATPPEIDGLITEACWETPDRVFFSPEGGYAQTDSTSFYFAYDKENLYLAAGCLESKMDSLAARVSERDGAVYGEDCVGYFIQPDIGKKEVYQVYFNPLGKVFDQKISPDESGIMKADRTWNGVYEVKTTSKSDGWRVEVRVPLTQFGTSGDSGKQCGVNFRRKVYRLNTSADWQVPIDYNPKLLGRLIFE